MTANDIADMVEKEAYHTNLNRVIIAKFIRQLQAENEALKKKIQNMALDLLSAHAQADDHWVELERLRKAQEK